MDKVGALRLPAGGPCYLIKGVAEAGIEPA